MTAATAATDSTVPVVQGGVNKKVAMTGPGAAMIEAATAAAQLALLFSTNSAASAPAASLIGTWFTGGSATTTKPQLLIEPTGTTSTGWSTSGTGLGVNAASGFTGNFFDGKVAGVTTFKINAATGAASVYTYNAVNWAVYDSVGGTLRSYEQGGRWFATDGFTSGGGSSGFGLLTTYNGLRLANSYWIGWSADSTFYGTNDLIVGRKAAATLQLGADAAGVTNQMFTAASRITSDGVGANLTIAAGNGRGAAGGTLIFSTYTTAGAATIGTLTTRMTIDTAGAIAFPNVTAVVTETVVSDRTLAVSINGTAYKICLKS